MAIFQNSIIPAAAAAAEDDVVTKSLRCDGGSTNDYLARDIVSGSTTRTKWVYSAWHKRAKDDAVDLLLMASENYPSSDLNISAIRINANGEFEVSRYSSSGYTFLRRTEAAYRDVAAWYHFVAVYDGTAGSAAARLKLYVNGVEETSFKSGGDYVDASSISFTFGESGYAYRINSSPLDSSSTSNYGYYADVYWLDGTVTLPSGFTKWCDVFAEEDETTGQWKPKATSGLTFGTNGFHLPFDSEDGQVFALQSDAVDGNTTFTDLSQHAHAITRNGNTEHSTDVTDPAGGSKSSMYFDGTGDYLSSTDAKDVANFDNSDWTLEFWVRPPVALGSSTGAFCGCGGGYAGWNSTTGHNWLLSTYSSSIYLQWWNGSSHSQITTPNSAVPTNSWTHFAVVNQSGTKWLYIGGVQKGSLTTATANTTSATTLNIGDSSALDGGVEVYIHNFSIQRDFCKYKDGTTFTPSTSPVTALSADIGFDSSSSGNHFDATNLNAASDIVNDTPTDNYCVWNPLNKTTDAQTVLSEGNLETQASADTNWTQDGIFYVNSGQWYFEVYLETIGAGNTMIGLVGENFNSNTYPYDSGEPTYGYLTSGTYYEGSSSASYGASYTTGDIIGVALDCDNGTVQFYKNNTGQGSKSGTNLTDRNVSPMIGGSHNGATMTAIANFGQDPFFAGGKTSGQDSSQSEFYYTPPTGFKSLSTGNLATPTIAKPSEHFNTLTYAGVSGTTKEVNGLDFTPALVWIKNRTSAAGWNVIFDSVRGGGQLSSNESDVELASGSNLAGYVSSYDADGFTVTEGGGVAPYLSTHETGDNYVAWNWKAGTSPSTSHTYALRLDLTTDNGSGWGDGSYDTPRLKVYEDRGSGNVFLGYATVTYDDNYAANYVINTNNKLAIEIVWEYDDSDGGMNAGYPSYPAGTLKDGSTTMATWAEGDPDVTDGATFIAKTSGQTATGTGTLVAGDGSDESYNADAGFSIIKWTGDSDSGGMAQDVSHSLGVAPELIIAKNRTDVESYGYSDWIVFHKDLDSNNLIKLNSTGAAYYSEYYPAITGVTTTEVGFQNDDMEYNYLNYTSTSYGDDTYIAYLFASKAGYSKVGSFEGNSSADGPFVYCSFRPAFILMKSADNAESWSIWDDKRLGYNPYQAYLAANSSSAEDATISAYNSNGGPDFLSNGFKMRGYAGSSNNSGTYIFYAVAESPLKYANAR